MNPVRNFAKLHTINGISNGVKDFRLVVACGGTAGHIFPAIAMADDIKKAHPSADISFAGVFNSHMRDVIRKHGYSVHAIKASAMPRGFNLLIFPFFLKAAGSFFRALDILKTENADVVVSMGSFSGAPFVFAGKFLGLPVIVHEQNVLPGRANRLTGYFADKVAVSYNRTASFFSKKLKRRIVLTGNPVRNQISGAKRDEALRFFGFDSSKFTLLVMGGSQGAHAVNMVFSDVAKELDKDRFQILHLTGKQDYEFVSGEYKKLRIQARAFAFLDDMGYAYAAADLILCRSGAITIAEITYLGLPAILIPYPYGDSHQKANADTLKDCGAAVVIEEKAMTKSLLLETIVKLSEDKEKLGKMKKNSKVLAMPDAAERLAKEVAGLAI